MFETVHYISSGKFISRGEWQHPDRIIHSHEILFVIEGTVFINENGTNYILKKNDVLLLQPHVRHFGYKKSSDTSFYWLHWDGNLLPEQKTLRLENPYHISLLFSQLLHYAADQSLPECLDYVTRLILAALCRSGGESTESKLVNRIAEWIKNNQDILLKTKDVAAHFGYNADYLSRLFKKYRNQNLKTYLDQAKLQFIKTQLLNTDYSLKTISDISGFPEYKYFLKFFKYHERLTPSEFCNTYFKTHINNK